MSMRPLFFLAALAAGCGLAHAQSAPSAPPAASDSWSRPAASATAGQAYGDGARDAARHDAGGASHFKFKDRGSDQPQRNAALEASGKAGVGGGAAMDRNGRPTVSCAQTPMDPACH